MFYGLYEPGTGSLEYVNAGHLPPVIRRADGRIDRITGATGSGLALGMFDAATYETNRVTIDPGDLLVLFTDGITEAENPQGVAFDDAGLERVVERTWMSDPQQIGRALLVNALVHTPAGTAVTLRVRRRVDHAVFEVEDDGAGIAPEHLERVFDRFYRVEGGQASGSGLGLAIARELAEHMGGDVRLASRPGRTTFTLTLPAAPVEQPRELAVA